MSKRDCLSWYHDILKEYRAAVRCMPILILTGKGAFTLATSAANARPRGQDWETDDRSRWWDSGASTLRRTQFVNASCDCAKKIDKPEEDSIIKSSRNLGYMISDL